MSHLTHLTTLDAIAVLLFFSLWIGYVRYHHWKNQHAETLMGSMHRYRHIWMMRVPNRDNRIVDSSILANLSNSPTFFASTTLLILGGLLALLGTKEKVATVVSNLPFAVKISSELWEVKIVLLLLIFIYAFFLFTWSLRLFNFSSILVGAAPDPGASAEECERFASRTGKIVSLAADNFNDGLRTYYFALAALMWFVDPWFFIGGSITVVVVIYRREFNPEALKVLNDLPKNSA